MKYLLTLIASFFLLSITNIGYASIADACQQGQTPVGNVRLTANNAVCLQDVSGGDQRQMAFHVDSDKIGKTLEIILSHGSGNGNLLHRHGSRPNSTTYDNISGNVENEERIIVPNVQGSWNYIHIRADTEFSNVTLLVRYIEDTPPTSSGIIDACQQGQTPIGNVRLTENTAVCLQDVSGGDQRQMSFHVDSDKIGETLEIILSHGSGNGNLLHRHGSRPNSTTHDNISDNARNDERIIVPNVQGSWNYIHVRADTAFSNVTLLVRYIDGNSCDTSIDTDGDRLPDCYETNTGKYLSPTNTGTSPNNLDTDGDSLSDGDEVLGTLGGLDLPALGVSPVHKDILIEYDWAKESLLTGSNSRIGSSCKGLHSHQPSASELQQITTSFANAPMSNPDGVNGIKIIHDYGQGGVFTGGNVIAGHEGILSDGVVDVDVDGSIGKSDVEFTAIKSQNFAANREGIFHYALMMHQFDTANSSTNFPSGQGEIIGDDFIVATACFGFAENRIPNTIMHELGHNLGLRHGGFENQNHKPNFNSIMNYRYQLNGGTDTSSSCDSLPSGGLDYSHGDRLTLNELSLNENLGVCGNVPIDFDGNGQIQNNVQHDFSRTNPGESTLLDHADWAHLTFGGLSHADGATFTEVARCQDGTQ